MDVIEVLKAKTEGMPDEVVITLTTQQGRALLYQLEAERQRAADLVLHVNTQANMREKAEEKYAEVSGWYVKMKTRMLKAEEELAQLVNGQRLAITDDMAMAFHAETTDSALGRDDMEEIKAGLQAVQELFTAPQKPVVPVGFLFVVKATGAVIYSIADAAIEGTQLIGQIYGDAAF